MNRTNSQTSISSSNSSVFSQQSDFVPSGAMSFNPYQAKAQTSTASIITSKMAPTNMASTYKYNDAPEPIS